MTEETRISEQAKALRWQLPRNLDDRITEAIYAESSRIAEKVSSRRGDSKRLAFQRKLDRLLTSPLTGFPMMGLVFATVLWLTIQGANVPSGLLASLLIDTLHPILREFARPPLALACRSSGGWHLSGHRLGHQCDAPTHGDLLSRLHHS